MHINKEEPKYTMKYFCLMRGYRPREACPKCNGFGVITYGSTATWRNGVGGSAMTHGICDECWGSGNKDRPWLNLRKLEASQSKKEESEFTKKMRRKEAKRNEKGIYKRKKKT